MGAGGYNGPERRRGDSADYNGPERRRDRQAEGGMFDSKLIISVFHAVLVAGITGTIVHVFSIPRLEEKIDALTKTVEEVKAEQKKMRDDIYTPRFSHSSDGKLAAFEPIAKGKQ